MDRFPYKIWILLFGVTIGWILFGTRDPEEKGDIIAQVLKVSGRTTLRRSGTYQWSPLKVKDKLYNFDSIASAEGASARIQLNDGTELVVPQDTQFRIEKNALDSSWYVYLNQGSLALERSKAELKANQAETMKIVTAKYRVDVTQLNGSMSLDNQGLIASKHLAAIRMETEQGSSTLAQVVAAQDPPKAPSETLLNFLPALTIKSLTEELNLDEVYKAKSLLSSSLKDAVTTVTQGATALQAQAPDSKEPKVALTETPKKASTPQPPRPLANERTEIKKPLATVPAPPPEKKDIPQPPIPQAEAELGQPSFPLWVQSQLKLWHFGPFPSGAGEPIYLDFKSKAPAAKNWPISVRVTALRTQHSTVVELPTQTERLKLPLRELPDWNPSTPRLDYTVSFVSKNTSQTESKEILGPQLTLSLLIPPTDRPLQMSLEGWNSAANSDAWTEDHPVTHPDLQMQVRSLQEVKDLIPYLQGAKAFEIKVQQAWPEEGYHLIKGPVRVATLTQSTAEFLKIAPELFGLQLIYKGKAQALVGATTSLNWSLLLQEEGDLLYPHKGQWIRVDKNLARSSEEARNLLKRVTPYLFRSSVPLVYTQNP